MTQINPKVKHTLAQSSSNVDIEDGQIFVQSDTKKLFVDVENTRLYITDIIPCESFPLAPISGKLYFSSLDNKARYYNGGSYFEWTLGPMHGSSAPTQSTSGVVGQRYLDTTNKTTYICTGVDESDLSNIVYEWTPLSKLDSNGKISSVSIPNDNETITTNSSNQIQAVGLKETNSSATQKVWVGTLSQYTAQGKDQSTDLCFITDDEESTPSAIVQAEQAKDAAILAKNQSQALYNSISEIAYGFDNITTIPAATSSVELSDGCWRHTPSVAPTYVLPDVSDETRSHSIIIDIDFSSVVSAAFEDENGNALVPQKGVSITSGDHWRFICAYTFGTWLIFPLKLDILSA